MRHSPLLLTAAAFAAAGALAIGTATLAAKGVEERSETAVRSALLREGLDFAKVSADGLRLTLTGTAPTEAERFRALSAAGREVDPTRVIDFMAVAESEALPPPRFQIEFLRNGDEISLIGLVPASADRDALRARIASATGAGVSDLLQTADHPSPEGWEDSLGWTLKALAQLPQSQVSMSADRVKITAAAESAEARDRLRAALRREVPKGLDIRMDLSAPRPVISPFTLRFRIEDGAARLDACSADTAEAARRIAGAAKAAGASADCLIGLGSPSPRWGEAAERGIAALADLGGGTLTMADTSVFLTAATGTDAALFDRVVGALETRLPPSFRLEAELPAQPDAAAGAAEFVVTRAPEGKVQLRGRLPDERTRTAVSGVAAARFGAGNVDLAARVAEGLPADWGIRVMSGLDALSRLESGALRVEEDGLSLEGVTGRKQAREEIAALLTGALGEEADFALDVSYDEALDPLAALPSPEECIEEVKAAQAEGKITFDPGSASPDADGRRAIDRVAAVLKGCPEMEIEVAAHSDSQGREAMNLALSQERAAAVVTALLERRVVGQKLDPVGYGEAHPVASNKTADGREANRRIEFTLPGAAQPEPIEASGEAGDEDEAE